MKLLITSYNFFSLIVTRLEENVFLYNPPTLPTKIKRFVPYQQLIDSIEFIHQGLGSVPEKYTAVNCISRLICRLLLHCLLLLAYTQPPGHNHAVSNIQCKFCQRFKEFRCLVCFKPCEGTQMVDIRIFSGGLWTDEMVASPEKPATRTCRSAICGSNSSNVRQDSSGLL